MAIYHLKKQQKKSWNMHPYANFCCARKNQKKWEIFKKCPLVFDAKCNQKNVTPEFEDFKFINFNVFIFLFVSHTLSPPKVSKNDQKLICYGCVFVCFGLISLSKHVWHYFFLDSILVPFFVRLIPRKW